MLKTVSLWIQVLFYVAAGVNHFRVTDFYVDIMPPYLPAHTFLVQLSGVAEIVLGAALLFPRLRRWAAWGIIAMLVVYLPVHVHMLVNANQFPEAPVWFLWFRFPLQGLFILWAWWYTRD